MSKGIELTQSQIKAYENRATIFMFPSNLYRVESEYDESIFPLQKGDKDVFIKEEFADCGCPDLCETCSGGDPILYRASVNPDGSYKNYYTCCEDEMHWTPASQMTKEQSRYSFKEILDVKVVRVQDIFSLYYTSLTGQKQFGHNDPDFDFSLWKEVWYNQQMQEQNINRTYEDNDYIFLVEVQDD